MRFDQEDVITTSGVFTRPLLHLINFGDDVYENNTLFYEAQGRTEKWIIEDNYEQVADSSVQFLQKYVGSELSNTITSQTKFVVPDTLSLSVVTLVMQEHEDFSVFNGSYQYDTSQYNFIKTN